MRRILAVLALALAFVATQASAQSLTTYTFATLPASPTAGQLAWITDNAGTPTVGSPAAGGAVAGNRDLVAYDLTQLRWEFVARQPLAGSMTPVSTLMDAVRIAYATGISGASATNVQDALDALFLADAAGGPADGAYGMSGSNATWQTVQYLSNLQRFEGLDPTIPWVRYWIDPYSGSDSNSGTYDKPFKTFGKWKALANFGTWFTVKNGGRGRTMYISDQTFPFPTGESCVIGETVTAGAKTAKILDIDVAAGKIVFETVSGGALVAGNSITTATQSGASCSWTLGTREPSIWDGTLALCSTDNLDTCSIGNRGTGTGCAAGICYAGSAVHVSLPASIPARYDGRIVSILDAEDPANPPVLHGDSLSLGGLDNTGLATNNERSGVFIAGGVGYGCLGIANIRTDAIIDDAISQHSEGCIKTLNVTSTRVINTSNAPQNNIVTTHNGTSGRGGVMSVNGGGVGYPYTYTSGAPVAPTAVGDNGAFMILINGAYVLDGTSQSGTDGLAPMQGTGGRNFFLNVDAWCRNLPGGTSGCQGWTFVATADSSFDFIRSVARTSASASAAGISIQAQGFDVTSKIYRPSFYSGGVPSRGIFLNASTGTINLDVKGAIFDALDFYVYDFSSALANLSGSISGVYDNDGTNAWHFGNAGADYTTAAAAAAGTGVAIGVMEDAYSIQTDATEYTTDFGTRCADTGECWDAYSQAWTVPFPEPVYDYLPVPILGYSETGQRSYGAR